MKNLSIKYKIWILVAAVTAFSCVIGMFGYSSLGRIKALALDQTGEVMMEGHRDKLKSSTEGMAIVLGTAIQGITDPQQRIDMLKELNSPTFFYEDKSGYFSIYAENGDLVSLPAKRSLEGKNLNSLKDGNGIYLVRDMIAEAQRGGGFVTYDWPKPGSEEPVTKLAYAEQIPGTTMVLATGIYIDDVEVRKADLRNVTQEMVNNTLWWGLGTILLYFLAVIVPLVIVLLRQIVRPVRDLTEVANEVSLGNLMVQSDYQSRDEIGKLAEALNVMTENLKQHADVAGEIANGNLKVNVRLASDKDMFGQALKQMVDKLNHILSQIQVAGEQINSASCQVADSSQTLSQGATETAASLEEISSSINQMASQTTQSAESASQANMLSGEASQAAAAGGEQMENMVSAMKEINEAGQNISKIIKVIDEIAFQTNLLALNAAVEAARAGQHGKGFAVVAEEVRNLAARSAKAASETAGLIEGSVEKTVRGTQIAEQTSSALDNIVSAISKVTDLVSEIAASSNEQAQGIAQVNQGLVHIDQGVQSNTATAEESASAAEELSSQSGQLQHMLRHFKLAGGQVQVLPVQAVAKAQRPVAAASSPSSWGSQAQSPQIVFDDNELDKF